MGRNEWFHYIIESKSIKKAFISIKGIYIQANVLGENITWVLPHSRAYTPPSDVDFRVMSTFTEFYTSLIGFTLFQLYKREDLVYPPQCLIESEKDIGLEKGQNEEKLKSLICGLVKSGEKGVGASSNEGENLEEQKLEENLDEDNEERKKLEEDEEKQQNLFKGLVFYFNREVPSEYFILVVRCLGGKVVLDEDDNEITHQIVDRPGLEMKHGAKRSYLQPQWVFDSVNAGLLMPVSRYLPGADLPAHLSPFVKHDGSYKPPERLEIEALQRGEDPGLIYGASAVSGEVEEDEEADAAEPEIELEEESDDESEEEEKEQEKLPEKPQGKRKAKNANVSKGKKDNPRGKHAEDAGEEKRLAKSAMPKKMKRLHDKIEYGKRKEKREVNKLQEKRAKHDKNLKQPEDKKRRMSTRNKK